MLPGIKTKKLEIENAQLYQDKWLARLGGLLTVILLLIKATTSTRYSLLSALMTKLRFTMKRGQPNFRLIQSFIQIEAQYSYGDFVIHDVISPCIPNSKTGPLSLSPDLVSSIISLKLLCNCVCVCVREWVRKLNWFAQPSKFVNGSIYLQILACVGSVYWDKLESVIRGAEV